MWRFIRNRKIESELQSIVKFVTEYFGKTVLSITIFGSYLRCNFKKNSDIDIAVILEDSKDWQWSCSNDYWNKYDDSTNRQKFYTEIGEFLKNLEVSRIYDIKLLTCRDLWLLSKFQLLLDNPRGNLVTAIEKGRVIFAKGGR